MKRIPRVMCAGAAFAVAVLLAACSAPATLGPSAPSPVPGAPSGTGPSASTSSAATSAAIPAWPRVKLVKLAGRFDHPLYVTSDGTGDGRLYVVEQTGKIRVIDADGRVAPKPFLDISALITSGGERGLLGLAFSQKFASDGAFYVDYTDNNGDTNISRYAVSRNTSTATGRGTTILHIAQPFPNHNGGCLQFGPDGYLYIGMGDGGSAGDPGNRAQNPNELLGKMLRIDVNLDAAAYKRAGVGLPRYAFPPGNPFTTVNHGRGPGAAQMGDNRGEIFLLGLRNPWRFSFDRATGDLFIGDVGQDLWEEIDVLPKGKGGFNMGWNLWEGDHAYPAGAKRTRKGFTFPVLEYPHPYGEAVIGGYVYRGSKYPQWDGLYFYGDEIKGWIAAMRPVPSGSPTTASGWQTRKVQDTGFPVSSFGQDDAGELYVCDLSGGAVYRMEPAK